MRWGLWPPARGRSNWSTTWGAWQTSIGDFLSTSSRVLGAWESLFGAKKACFGGSARWLLERLLHQMKADRPERTRVLHAAYTCPSVMQAIDAVGLTRVPIDLHVSSGTMKIDGIHDQCDARTLCVITGNLFGAIDPIDEISGVCTREGSYLIEDLALCIGASYKGRLLGTWGDAALVSLGLSKPLTTLYGGILLIRDESLQLSTHDQHRAASIFDVTKALVYPIVFTPRLFSMLYPVIKKQLSSTEHEAPQATWQLWQLVLSGEQLKALESEVLARHTISKKWLVTMAPVREQVIGNLNPGSYFSRLMLVEADEERRRSIINNCIKLGFCATEGYAGARAWIPKSASGAGQIARGLITLPCYPGVPQDDMAKVVAMLSR